MYFDPRKRFDLVKDPIHGYIRFTREKIIPEEEATEADLINSKWLQRLRHIHQLQTAWFVYPAADHTRFSHALGCMDLAGKFAKIVYEPFYNYYQGKIDGEVLPEINYVVETFRIAGLLHDVGHGPFTHLLDSKFLKPKYNITHEDVGTYIIKQKLKDYIEGIRRSPDGHFEEKLNVDIICNLIKKGGETDLDSIWRPLHQIIRGAYDADKMDFLLRDGLLCGESGLTIADIDRLMRTTFLSPETSLLQLHYSSIPLLISFIRFRQRMLEVVYYHRTVRAIELMIGETISSVMKELITTNPKDNLDGYCTVTEHCFFHYIDQLRNENDLKKREVVETWDSVFSRNIVWKQLEKSERFIHNPRELYTSLTAQELEMRIKDDTNLIPKETFIVDSPAIETPGNVFSFSGDLTQKDKIVIYYSENRQDPLTIDNLATTFHIPIKAIQYRLYVKKDLGHEQKSALSRSFKKYTCGESSYTSSLDSSF